MHDQKENVAPDRLSFPDLQDRRRSIHNEKRKSETIDWEKLKTIRPKSKYECCSVCKIFKSFCNKS